MTHGADLTWGEGPRLLELFLEPTCPFSATSFAKIDDVLAGTEGVRVRIWLLSQPWHLFSPFHTRAILAAACLPGGRDAAKHVMAALYADMDAYSFQDHATGPNRGTTPDQLLARISDAVGIDVLGAFDTPELVDEIKRHTRYARQNGIHVSPTAMLDGLVSGDFESSASAADWIDALRS